MSMKTYSIVCPVKTVSGCQWFSVEASSPEEALRIFKEHGGELVDEELEVQSLGDPYVGGEVEEDLP